MERIHLAFDYQAVQVHARELRQQEIDRLLHKAIDFFRSRIAARRRSVPQAPLAAAPH